MATFPTGVNPYYSWFIIPKFNTKIVEYGGANEQRIALDSTATYHHKIRYKNLDPTEKDLILNHFISMKGSYESFTWTDPNSVNRNVRFKEDLINIEYFQFNLYHLNEVEFKEVV